MTSTIQGRYTLQEKFSREFNAISSWRDYSSTNPEVQEVRKALDRVEDDAVDGVFSIGTNGAMRNEKVVDQDFRAKLIELEEPFQPAHNQFAESVGTNHLFQDKSGRVYVTMPADGSNVDSRRVEVSSKAFQDLFASAAHECTTALPAVYRINEPSTVFAALRTLGPTALRKGNRVVSKLPGKGVLLVPIRYNASLKKYNNDTGKDSRLISDDKYLKRYLMAGLPDDQVHAGKQVPQNCLEKLDCATPDARQALKSGRDEVSPFDMGRFAFPFDSYNKVFSGVYNEYAEWALMLRTYEAVSKINNRNKVVRKTWLKSTRQTKLDAPAIQ